MSLLPSVMRAVFFTFLVSILVACGTRQANTEVTRCVYPDSPRYPAPSFICEAAVNGFPLTILRQSAKSDASMNDRINVVLEDQNRSWAAEFSAKWYTNAVQRIEAELFLQAYFTETSRVVRSRLSPKSILWLVVGLPKTETELLTLTYDAVPPVL